MTWCACRPIRSVIIRLFSKQIALPLRGRQICLFIGSLKVMLQETIRNTALQHCCDIVSNGQNMGPALLRCVGLVRSSLQIVPCNNDGDGYENVT